MYLSDVLNCYLLTSVSEGTNLVYWTDVSDAQDGSTFRLTYMDRDLNEYEADFDDQKVTWTNGNEFVISCDGQPWTFASLVPAERPSR